MPFPDVELALADLFVQLVPSQDHTGTDTPANLDVMLPFIRIGRIGGPDDGVTDFGSYDVDFFAATRVEAVQLATEARELLHRTRRAGAFLIDHVRTDVGPRRLPWPNPKIRRWSATYTVTARRQ